MSKNEFDALLLKKLQEEELPYDPAGWDRMARSLPPALSPATASAAGRPWLKITGIAAAVALAVSALLVIQLKKRPGTPAPATAVHQQSATPAGAPAGQGGNRVLPEAQQPQLARQTDPAARHVEKAPVQPQPAQGLPTGNGHYVPGDRQPANNAGQELAHQPAPQTPPPAGALPREPQATLPETVSPPASAVAGNTPSTAMSGKSDAWLSPFYEGKGVRRESKTSVSLGGGVNYGNLNTGYTAGVSVRRKVAGDFFVDGTVAMMYNNNANNVAANNGPSLDGGRGPAAKPASFNQTSLASPALEPIQKLYYVQFNPSFGYQVEKHVALSVGGDFQQMLNRQEEIVKPESNNAKVFPGFDVGLTTKSEFSITPNIQAGLMYREGLNNLVKNDGSRFVNRRYVQVQFKYNIPVN